MRTALLFTTLSVTAAWCQCPLEFVKVMPTGGGLTKFNQVMGTPKGAPVPLPRFELKVRNASGKQIRGLKVRAAYFDSTEDLHVIPVSWGASESMKPGATRTLSWENAWADTSSIGWIVSPVKVLFDDGSAWVADEDNLRGCFGEDWVDRKHPRLTKIPLELLGPEEAKK